MTDVTEVKKLVKDLESKKPAVATKAAGKIIAEVDFRTDVPQPKIKPKPKTVFVELGVGAPKVTFTGKDWCAVDIKTAYAAIVRKFKEGMRELYRKEYKKK